MTGSGEPYDIWGCKEAFQALLPKVLIFTELESILRCFLKHLEIHRYIYFTYTL